MNQTERALVEVGRLLRAAGYEFVTPTPLTHARVNARRDARVATDLRGVFGWSRPAPPALIPAAMLEALHAADALEPVGELVRARVRFSTLPATRHPAHDGGLYVHSAFPTEAGDAVFFGPDTYRFCALLARTVGDASRIVDVGAGSGAGGLSLATGAGAARTARIVLADVNLHALSMALVNAELAGCRDRVELVRSDVLDGVTPCDGGLDVVIANPPYLVDPQARAYRHGGDALGTALGVRIVRDALAFLPAGGQLVVYTGVPIVGGRDVFRDAVAPLLDARGAAWTYDELDPDVFGESLDEPAYAGAGVERIAAVSLLAKVPHAAVP